MIFLKGEGYGSGSTLLACFVDQQLMVVKGYGELGVVWDRVFVEIVVFCGLFTEEE